MKQAWHRLLVTLIYGFACSFFGFLSFRQMLAANPEPWPFPAPPQALLVFVALFALIVLGAWKGTRWTRWLAIALHGIVPLIMCGLVVQHYHGEISLGEDFTLPSFLVKLSIHVALLCYWIWAAPRPACAPAAQG